MHISREYGFAYLALARTSSRSMAQWLQRHYGAGRVSLKEHHSMALPAGFNPEIVFTIVRNPYTRRSSEYLAHRAGGKPRRPEDFPRYMAGDRRFGPLALKSQWESITEGAVQIVLYYERLPGCLMQLPFVRQEDVTRYPRIGTGHWSLLAHGALFGAENEALVWNRDRADFDNLHYERNVPWLPAGAPDAMRMT